LLLHLGAPKAFLNCRDKKYPRFPILDFIGAKDDGDGGDKWSYKKCKAPVKSLPPTSQHPVF